MGQDPRKSAELKQSASWRKSEENNAGFFDEDRWWGKESLSGHERNKLFLSDRGRQFSDVSAISGADDIGDGRACVVWDYDRDGWQDIALVNTNAPKLMFYRNLIGERRGRDRAGGQFVAVRFVGGNRTASSSAFAGRDGYGARVTIELDSAKVTREHRCGEGFSAQNSSTYVIGIGKRLAAGAVAVRWPSGAEQNTQDVPAGTLLTVFENPRHSPDGSGFAREPYVRAVGRGRAGAGERPVLGFGSAPPAAAKVRVYTLMATWCTACKKELPQLGYLRSKFSDSEVAMFGLPADPKDGPAKLSAYVAEYRPPYALVPELGPDERKAVRLALESALGSRAEAIPATIITDTTGTILETIAGVPDASTLAKWIR